MPQVHEAEKQKHLRAAQQLLARAAAAKADDAAVWATSAVCSAAQARPDDALAAVQKALQLQPSEQQAAQLAQVVQSCARQLARKQQHAQLAACVQAAAAVAEQLPAAGKQQLKEGLQAAVQGEGKAAVPQEVKQAVDKLG